MMVLAFCCEISPPVPADHWCYFGSLRYGFRMRTGIGTKPRCMVLLWFHIPNMLPTDPHCLGPSKELDWQGWACPHQCFTLARFAENQRMFCSHARASTPGFYLLKAPRWISSQDTPPTRLTTSRKRAQPTIRSKVRNGVCSVEGLLWGGAWGHLATLPADCRPSNSAHRGHVNLPAS